MKRSYKLAGGIAIISVLWVASGDFRHATLVKAEPLPVPDANAPVRVKGVKMTASGMNDTISISGQTAANRTANLAAEVSGQVQRIVVSKGTSVKSGDSLIQIAVEDRETAVASARALVAQREKEYDAAQKLQDKGYNSEIRLKDTKSQLENAKSILRRTEISLEKTFINAPFDGIFNNKSVNVGDFVNPGSPVATVVDLDPLKIVGYASEKAMATLKKGAEVDVRLISGETFTAKITYLSASADPATRTFRVEAEAENPGGISDGMTAEMLIRGKSRMGYNISPAVLTLADDGQIGIMVADKTGTASFLPVEILAASPEGVWVGGLPDEITLITVGQQYAIPGQKVEVVLDPPAKTPEEKAPEKAP